MLVYHSRYLMYARSQQHKPFGGLFFDLSHHLESVYRDLLSLPKPPLFASFLKCSVHWSGLSHKQWSLSDDKNILSRVIMEGGERERCLPMYKGTFDITALIVWKCQSVPRSECTYLWWSQTLWAEIIAVFTCIWARIALTTYSCSLPWPFPSKFKKGSWGGAWE